MSMSMSRPKNSRRLENHQFVDRISILPDHILHHILSFVPTKSAVRLSILSKQWRYIWTKVPNLDFTEMPCSNAKRFSQINFYNFVNKVLVHNDASYVRRLGFCVCEGDIVGDIAFYFKSWLCAIKEREIREIDITLGWTTQLARMGMPLPTEFLSSEKLVVLKLDGPFTFNVPDSLHLPNLEVIHLIRLQLPNDEFMKNLSSGCPVLKELHIERCYFISTMYVSSLTLKTLKVIHNKQSLRSSQSSVVVKAPNLGYLHIEERVKQYDICEMSSLDEAILNIFKVENTFQVLSRTSTVKSLRVKLYLPSLVPSPPSLEVFAAKTFGNLTCLKLNAHCIMLCSFLKCAPMLKSLIIENVPYWKCPYEYKSMPNHLRCLESVELQRCKGNEEDMDFMEYILKAGLVLKKMKIILSPRRVVSETIVCQKLLMLPRSSAICQVEVIT